MRALASNARVMASTDIDVGSMGFPLQWDHMSAMGDHRSAPPHPVNTVSRAEELVKDRQTFETKVKHRSSWLMIDT